MYGLQQSTGQNDDMWVCHATLGDFGLKSQPKNWKLMYICLITCRRNKCIFDQAKACSRCKAVAYCTQVTQETINAFDVNFLKAIMPIPLKLANQAHQASDWSRHKSNCHPVVVAELKGRGRGLVATRQVITDHLVYTLT